MIERGDEGRVEHGRNRMSIRIGRFEALESPSHNRV
jgi:hypothetical protein